MSQEGGAIFSGAATQVTRRAGCVAKQRQPGGLFAGFPSGQNNSLHEIRPRIGKMWHKFELCAGRADSWALRAGEGRGLTRRAGVGIGSGGGGSKCRRPLRCFVLCLREAGVTIHRLWGLQVGRRE